MHLPHRNHRAASMPARLMHSAAAGAGTLRLALKQRTIHPKPVGRWRLLK